MGLTADQQIPVKKQEKSEWTMRALFPAKAMASAVANLFSSVFEAILGALILVISIAELLDKDVLPLYALAVLVASAVFYERNFKQEEK